MTKFIYSYKIIKSIIKIENIKGNDILMTVWYNFIQILRIASDFMISFGVEANSNCILNGFDI